MALAETCTQEAAPVVITACSGFRITATEEEIAATLEQVFQRLDSDKIGFVGQEQLRRFAYATGFSEGHEETEDTWKNSYLEIAEHLNLPKEGMDLANFARFAKPFINMLAEGQNDQVVAKQEGYTVTAQVAIFQHDLEAFLELFPLTAPTLMLVQPLKEELLIKQDATSPASLPRRRWASYCDDSSYAGSLIPGIITDDEGDDVDFEKEDDERFKHLRGGVPAPSTRVPSFTSNSSDKGHTGSGNFGSSSGENSPCADFAFRDYDGFHRSHRSSNKSRRSEATHSKLNPEATEFRPVINVSYLPEVKYVRTFMNKEDYKKGLTEAWRKGGYRALYEQGFITNPAYLYAHGY